MFKRVAVLICFALLSNGATSASYGDKYAIINITAHLYHEDSGSFDKANITTESSPTLWNTIIGEGEAGSPSGATLMLVKLRGNWLSGAKPPKLKFVVEEKGRTELLSQTVNLRAFFSKRDTLIVPFIAYGTGCSVIRATATLINVNGNGVRSPS